MSTKRSSSDVFTSEANEKVVAIIAKETGFQGIQPQAMESLSNILGSYIEKMLTSAHLFAELGNRAKPNIHDITRSLENVGIQINTFQEYLATHINDNETVTKTSKYFKTAKSNKSTLEQIPEFLPSENEESDEEDEDTENGVPTYVPPHLPSFPSKHSFRQTPIYIQRPDDPQKVRELNSEQSRTVEENLKKLMSAENQLLRQANVESATALLSTTKGNNIMMPIVNYEGFIQRRKRSKISGTTLNVEGSDELKKGNKKSNNNDGEEDELEAAAEAAEEFE
ncbi:Bromodomain associated-domain-containing protein [Helicostylum pulchrum]|uniref:Transcription initiation factor TFIID subunit 8 n=1 Tax=Helicostylum pulchrum TaxID=562976 RepID=A0ABP9XWR0_9FUNG|nr:Bromodomain associated-domain-containing protein [Helicostylum pulchrum]